MNNAVPHHAGVSMVLAEAWGLFIAGLFTAFPWVLAAEIIAILPVSCAGSGILNTDLGRFLQPEYLVWNLCSVCVQAALYVTAISRLARSDAGLADNAPRKFLKTVLSLLIGYLIYELLVLLGLGFALILFLPVLFLFGVVAALMVALIPLVPTAWISTALAFFAFPAVLEQCGPFAALGRSLRLARSHWAHAALVVSVPAIVLLCVAVLQDYFPIMHVLHETESSLAHLSSPLTMAQLQNLLTSLSAQTTTGTHPLWTTITLLLSALAWWYTLTVCYVEYKMLKSMERGSNFGTRDAGN